MNEPGRKEERVYIRLSPQEKEGFREAADISGIDLSTWIRERLRRAAVLELGEAGRIAPFLRTSQREA
jgi:uncharacterized protein (DUF1778 family)